MRDEHKPHVSVPPSPVVLSRWVNEPYLSLTELLSAHDAARLTRKTRWLLLGLSLIGQFPGRVRFRGRRIGWRRSDVLEWMARDLALKQDRMTSPSACSEEEPRQSYLPLTCRTPGTVTPNGSIDRVRALPPSGATPNRRSNTANVASKTPDKTREIKCANKGARKRHYHALPQELLATWGRSCS
jgi:predicted DNA-binding transcriptional regulator AlpA